MSTEIPRPRILLSIALLLYSTAAHSACIPKANAGRWAIDGRLVTDRSTGLTWMRCTVGQRWDGKRCIEPPQYHTWLSWEDAHRQVARLSDDGGGWRLPSLAELKTLVEPSCGAPRLDSRAFPGATAAMVWSASEYESNGEYAWRVDFGTGKANADLKRSVSYRLRPVRGEMIPAKPVAPASAVAAAPQPAAPAGPDDGVHDGSNPSLALLQPPADALSVLPRSAQGRVDWVRALRGGYIAPRAELAREGTLTPFELDILMLRTKEMPYVRFPHAAHTEWLACSNCHPAIFEPKAGANAMGMDRILGGEFCGRCHGRVAFSTLECDRCHNVPRE